ncbi:hypothetical protein [Craurococcus roseus]
MDILHDPRRFSIRYSGSSNLNYDGTNINSDYNSHVQRLHRAILSQPTT